MFDELFKSQEVTFLKDAVYSKRELDQDNASRILKVMLENEGWLVLEDKADLSELDEAKFSDIKFTKIAQELGDLFNVKAVKEKLEDGLQTLMIKIQGDMYQDEIAEFEGIFPGYFFDYDRRTHIVRVHQEA